MGVGRRRRGLAEHGSVTLEEGRRRGSGNDRLGSNFLVRVQGRVLLRSGSPLALACGPAQALVLGGLAIDGRVVGLLFLLLLLGRGGLTTAKP